MTISQIKYNPRSIMMDAVSGASFGSLIGITSGAAMCIEMETIRGVDEVGRRAFGIDSRWALSQERGTDLLKGRCMVINIVIGTTAGLILGVKSGIKSRGAQAEREFEGGASGGDLTALRALIADGVLNRDQAMRERIFFIAAREGYLEIVRELLLHTDPNFLDQEGRTFLIQVVQQERPLPQIVDLIAQYADYNVRDRTGHSALDYAIQLGRPELVRILVSRFARLEPLPGAESSRRLSMREYIAARGWNLTEWEIVGFIRAYRAGMAESQERADRSVAHLSTTDFGQKFEGSRGVLDLVARYAGSIGE